METIISFIFAVLALMIVPGPDMAYCVANGLRSGKRGALLSAIGIGIGGLVLAITTAFVVFFAQEINQSLIVAIQLAGCLYLLYLGFSIVLPPYSNTNVTQQSDILSRDIITGGIITNLSNPKALVFFLSFIPQFISPESNTPGLDALILGLILCIIGTSINFIFGLTGTMGSTLNSTLYMQRSLGQYILSFVFFTVALSFIYKITRDFFL